MMQNKEQIGDLVAEGLKTAEDHRGLQIYSILSDTTY